MPALGWLLNLDFAGSGAAASAPPPIDDSDPPITGGGRIIREGQWPEWWENWEEPQPTEAPPKPKANFAELIAEAASKLDMPAPKLSAPPAQEVKPIPIRRFFTARMMVKESISVLTAWHKEGPEDPVWAFNALLRRQKRQAAALLLLRLLD